MAFKIQISGPPEEVGRLRFLSENSEMITHVLGKMRQQKLDPADTMMVFIALSDDNPLGFTFMRTVVDPDFVPMEDRAAFACTMTRKDLGQFFKESAPTSLPIAESDLAPNMTRMVVIALDGATYMDAEFPPAAKDD
jgi:hypothetical protein